MVCFNNLATLLSHNFKIVSLPSKANDIQLDLMSPILWLQGA